MKIRHHDQIAEPLETPTGEIIYELIGRASGGDSDPGYSLARIQIQPGKSSSQHVHKISQESYYILEGEGHLEIDGKGFTLHPGQVCLIEPGEVHQISNHGVEDLVFLAVCVPAWVAEDSFEGTSSF